MSAVPRQVYIVPVALLRTRYYSYLSPESYPVQFRVDKRLLEDILWCGAATVVMGHLRWELTSRPVQTCRYESLREAFFYFTLFHHQDENNTFLYGKRRRQSFIEEKD